MELQADNINALVNELGRQIGVLTVEAAAQRLRADTAEIEVTRLRGEAATATPAP